MKRAMMTTAALVLGLGLAVPVFAQQQPGPGAGPGGDHGRHFSRMCEDQDARLAGMLAYAEKKLNITDQQRAAWTKFADTAKASQKHTQDLCTKYKDQPMPAAAPARLERMEAMMSARLAQLQEVRPALTDLYAQLTPDQQKQADRFLNRAGRGMGGGMGDGMGGHHGMRGHGPGPMHGEGPGQGPGPDKAPRGG
ncbi:Spy/CpxP family protein refolding chaperone [Azospirillum isscasi]|uniref:Spy/CpxP family protein refolding chaperone n=1 Tax=Azospirillum isscasi TaxID=3053926 RepID=A0ABU0WES5_9PROT|nr:Spy/CpxP family protein refolding chaperone [Azospirillum isscasi]MDQ2102719.1 Spy/CpxP family protein refolding chaperone [Azospirillum isscasi]